MVRVDIDLSDTVAGLLGAIPVFAFAAFGALTPAVSRRLGLEVTLVLALGVSGAGEVARAAATTAPAFLAWTGVALAGMGMGNVLLPPLAKRYFPDRVGAVTAVYSVMLSLSAALPPLVVVSLARQFGWRPALGGWALIAVVAAVPWIVVIVRSATARRRLAGPIGHAPVSEAVEGRHRGTGRVWRSPLAWGLAVMFAMNSLNFYAMLAWLPQILIDAGLSESTAASYLGMFALVGIPMSVVVPPVAARMRNPISMVVIFTGSLAVGYLGLALAPTAAALAWCVLAGLGAGTFPLVLALLNLRSSTSAGAVSLSGFVQGLGYLVAGTGPLLIGVLREASGSWTTTYLFLGVTVALMLAGSVVGCRPGTVEETWGRAAGRADGAEDRPARR